MNDYGIDAETDIDTHIVNAEPIVPGELVFGSEYRAVDVNGVRQYQRR